MSLPFVPETKYLYQRKRLLVARLIARPDVLATLRPRDLKVYEWLTKGCATHVVRQARSGKVPRCGRPRVEHPKYPRKRHPYQPKMEAV